MSWEEAGRGEVTEHGERTEELDLFLEMMGSHGQVAKAVGCDAANWLWS